MRAKQIAVRAALVCGAAGIACALWSATDDTAAHADDRPSSIEQPGGLLDQVLPDKPEPAAPAPVDEPAPPTTEPPADPIVELPPAEAPPIVVEAPPVADPIVVETPPVVEATPADPTAITLPDVVDIPAATAPRLPLPAPAIPLGTLQLLVGPVPAATPPPGARHSDPAPEAGHLEVAVCDGTQADPLDMAAPAERVTRTHPRVDQLAAPGPTPCDPDGGQDFAAHLASVTAPSQSGGDHLAATLPAVTVYPTLRLLRELRPRGDLPATRSLHIEPRPA